MEEKKGKETKEITALVPVAQVDFRDADRQIEAISKSLSEVRREGIETGEALEEAGKSKKGVEDFLNNLKKTLPVLKGIGSAFVGLSTVAGKGISSIIKVGIEYNQDQEGGEIFENQLASIQENLSATAGTLTTDLFSSLTENTLPMVNDWTEQLLNAAGEGGVEGAIETSASILTQMVNSLVEGAPQMMETASGLINTFLETLQESAPILIEGAANLMMTLISGFMETFPQLAETAGTLITSFLTAIQEHGPEILENAINIIGTLANGFIDMVPQLIETAGILIGALINGILSNLPEILQSAITLSYAILEGILLAIPEILLAIGDLMINLVQKIFETDWNEVGNDIVKGLIEGLQAKAADLVEKAKELGKKALDAFKDFFGIKSPSRVMKEQIGVQLIAGMAEGLEEDDEMLQSSRKVSQRLIGELTQDVRYHMPDVRSAAKNLTANMGAQVQSSTTITVPLYVEGREIARASAWYMGQQLDWEVM